MGKTIYNIKLHEWITFDDISLSIIIVPGGWIYESADDTTFVPYNDEFNEVVTPIRIEDSNSNSTRPLANL